jgi:hypothetical protein
MDLKFDTLAKKVKCGKAKSFGSGSSLVTSTGSPPTEFKDRSPCDISCFLLKIAKKN